MHGRAVDDKTYLELSKKRKRLQMKTRAIGIATYAWSNVKNSRTAGQQMIRCIKY